MKKRAFTLMEIMIVILLIGIIGGVISYNMRGSLEKGRAFKTEQQISQITDILEMELARGEYTKEDIIKNPRVFLKRAGWVKDPDKFMLDGWNVEFAIVEDHVRPDRIIVQSKGLESYKQRQRNAAKNLKEVVTAEAGGDDN